MADQKDDNRAMFHAEEDIFHRNSFLAWILFSLAAGSVNAGAFKACRNFVTHVTGTLTSMGVDAPDVGLALEYCSVFVSFIVGAILAVFLIETLANRAKHLVLLPFFLAFALITSAAVAGHLGAFGPFGDVVETPGSFALLAILAGAMGIQNAAVSYLTRNAVRTTHLTGPTTDLATSIVRAGLGGRSETHKQLRWVALRSLSMAAFILGAYLSAKYAATLEYRVFCIGAFSLAAAVLLAFSRLFVTASEPRVAEHTQVRAEKE